LEGDGVGLATVAAPHVASSFGVVLFALSIWLMVRHAPVYRQLISASRQRCAVA
jgi:hypothetical protein